MIDADRRLPLNLRAGLAAVALFTALGLLLEALHAFKLGWYLDVGSETRRLLLRLGHAHGALLGLLNVCYALCAATWTHLEDALVGRALLAALVLMPSGFLLGGCFARGADPGAAIGLAAAGGVALLCAVARWAWKAH